MKKQPPPFAPRRQRKLRNFLIDPKYQLKYVMVLNAVGLLMFISTTLVCFISIKMHLSTIIENDVLLETGLSLPVILPILIGLAGIFIFVTTLIGIYVSHKTAGPMYRFRVSFEQVEKGNLGLRIKLRPGDDFQDVATGFNKMMDSIEARSERTDS